MKTTVNAVLLSIIASLAAATFSIDSHACSVDGKEGFLPQNDLYIPPRREILDGNGAPLGGGITEAEFNGVIDAVVTIYAPVVAKMGGTLKVARNWTDGTVNAYANREGSEWWINMFGGLARHKETTIDGFMLVVCHELGHHIGGAPKYSTRGRPDEWAGNEGQSDYWATLKCARRVLGREVKSGDIDIIDAPDSVRRKCTSFYRDTKEAAVCVRSAMGGLSLARLLASLKQGGTPEDQMPWFSRKDKHRVAVMFDAHPAAQCRLDTYYSGSLCDKDFNEDVSQIDAVTGTCTQADGYTFGYRPRCWYAPPNAKDDAGDPRSQPRSPAPPTDGLYY